MTSKNSIVWCSSSSTRRMNGAANSKQTTIELVWGSISTIRSCLLRISTITLNCGSIVKRNEIAGGSWILLRSEGIGIGYSLEGNPTTRISWFWPRRTFEMGTATILWIVCNQRRILAMTILWWTALWSSQRWLVLNQTWSTIITVAFTSTRSKCRLIKLLGSCRNPLLRLCFVQNYC